MHAVAHRTPGGGRAATGWLAGLCLSLGLGCANDFERHSGPAGPVIEHKKLGYSIAESPVSSGYEWERVDVEGTDLAYRNDEGAAISLSSRCRSTRASVATLARQLTIGTSRDDLLAAGPLEHAGFDGWSQTFDSAEGDRVLRIKAITLMTRPCVFDWLLVAPGPSRFDRAEPGFDDWMQSFVPPRSAGEGAVPVDSPEPSSASPGEVPEPVSEESAQDPSYKDPSYEDPSNEESGP